MTGLGKKVSDMVVHDGQTVGNVGQALDGFA
jgi:hypothetical protein